MRRTALHLSLLATLASPLALAQSAPASGQTVQPVQAVQVASVEGITEHRLPNGLRIVLAPDAAKATTTVNITYLVGSRHENYGETGMAHLLEHLLFKGTPSLPGKTIPGEFARRGMSVNGTTAQDRTNYFETFTASDDNLDWALRMEADRMVNSVIARADLDSEMTVVRNEMEMGENSPGRMLMQQTMAAAYRWHNYGKAPIGARSDVENVSIDNLRAFYRRYYQPDNAVLVVAGKFDPAATLARIERYFGPIPRPQRVLPAEPTVEPAQEGARELVVMRPGDTRLVAAQYHVSPGAHPDTTALSLLTIILADTPGGRLYKALVERGQAASIGSAFYAMKDPGALLFMAQASKDQPLAAARAGLITQIEGFAEAPVTEAELERARVRMRNAYEQYMNDPGALGIALSEAIAKGDWRLFFLARDRIETTTLADVQRVAQNYFQASNRTLGVFLPAEQPPRAQVPAAPDIAAMVSGYQGRPALAAVAPFDPSPANIEAHTTRQTLANGMQLALLPKPARGEVVHGVLVLRMGDAQSLHGLTTVGALTAAMLRRGSAGMDRQQIADRIEALRARVGISGGSEQVTVSFETRRAHLPEVLALLRGLLRAPTFPEAEFETLRQTSIAELESVQREPGVLASNALGRHGDPYPVGDPRHARTIAENVADLRAATLAQVRDFHARFYGASHAQLSLVGDFDGAAAAAQVAELFGDWTAPQPYARVDRPFVPIPAAEFTLPTPGKANAVYLATAPIDLTNDAPDYALMMIANRVLGGASLRSRLADRLRQRDGVSYGASSWMQVGALDRAGRFGVRAQYAPQSLPRVQRAVNEELERLVREGITAQELHEAVSGLLQQGMVSRSHDAALAGALASQLYLGRTMAFTAQLEQRLRDATTETVNAAIRRYMQPGMLSRAYAGDFAGAAAQAAPAAPAGQAAGASTGPAGGTATGSPAGTTEAGGASPAPL
ncbi:insulinase family protein [Cupriavidus taiwanensis]|uniref:M16 family metallopeptidase n=1 Tax=Cupriavidus taiwanensis TaxID=164546 RepID=UPI002540B9AD|nr:insulinase family protein [Cupriavidus taiwanensis]MDK3023719.1 insulinase family protein [Cupriavidus taiwanensis]